MICRSKFGLTSTIMDDHPVLSKLFYKILPREQWKSPKLIELFVSTNIKGKFVYCFECFFINFGIVGILSRNIDKEIIGKLAIRWIITAMDNDDGTEQPVT